MLKEIYIDQIDLSPFRPKDTQTPTISESEIAIARETLVIPPILVRHNRATGRYELVQGERYYHLAKFAQIDRIPADIQALTNTQVQSLVTAEAGHHNNASGDNSPSPIDPIAQARQIDAYRQQKLSYQAIAQKLGIDRGEAAHRHTLIRLQPEIQKLISNGTLRPRHGRLLAKLTKHHQTQFAREAVLRNWSVRDLQAAIAGRPAAARRHVGRPRRPLGERKRDVDTLFRQSNQDPDIAQFERQLVEQIGQPARVVTSNEYQGGLLVIRYFSNDELTHLTHKLAGKGDEDLFQFEDP